MTYQNKHINITSILFIAFAAIFLAACNSFPVVDEKVNSLPTIFPDYSDVTYPPNMVAPHFSLTENSEVTETYAIFSSGNQSVKVKGKGLNVSIPQRKWKKLINPNDTISILVIAKKDGKWIEYNPFNIYIAPDSIDSYLAYRLIEPGYESWNEMGIYQRCLENFDEKEVFSNCRSDFGCVNCHSFCINSPDRMLFHLRVKNPGTYIVDGQVVSKLNTKTPETISALVYPSWHPSGKFVAFSTNETTQKFHTSDKNRIEVMDFASDVVVLDVEKNEIVTSPLLCSSKSFETFPAFSPDGETLYFCTADSIELPDKYTEVKYSLCSIGFNPETRTFSEKIDTLFHAHKDEWGSVSFPRVSPDGKYIMYTLSGYGNFSIWHKDADLHLMNAVTKESKELHNLNSEDTESYHSWSSNGRWIVYSSRRIDGLYTRPFIAYIDEEGQAAKPFLLPQDNPEFYSVFMKSYNIPEFVKGEISISPSKLEKTAKDDKGSQTVFSNCN